MMIRYNVESNDPYDMEPAPDGMWVLFDDVQAAIDAATACERERCAKVCETLRHPDGWSCEHDEWVAGTNHCAAAIRAIPTAACASSPNSPARP